MSTLETIHLRISRGSCEHLGRQILESIPAAPDGAVRLSVYRRAGLDCDIAVHIHHPEGRADHGPSPLGVRLAAALTEHGLVEHTVWEELT